MSNYVKATNFATKDTLPTGDSNKIVKGTEIDNEFNAIAGAVSSKADLSSPALTGTPTSTTAAAGTNTTQIATTAFVINERTTSGTLTNKTLTSPVVSGLSLTDGSFVVEGSTADDFETTVAFTNPTADRTITFPDKTGTVALTSDINDTALFTTSGTYTIAGTTMSVSASSHGRSVGDVVYLNFTSGTAVDGYFTVTAVPNGNTFEIGYGSSITASGNVTGYYSNKGLISIASPDEVINGSSTTRAATPAGVQSAITNRFNISGSAPVYGVRAWVNFDCTKNAAGTVTTENTNRYLAGTGNVASVLKNSTGNYTVTFTTAMPDANYAVSSNFGTGESTPADNYVINVFSVTSSGFSFNLTDPTQNSNQNPPIAMLTIVR
jgi:hypothetical protein